MRNLLVVCIRFFFVLNFKSKVTYSKSIATRALESFNYGKCILMNSLIEKNLCAHARIHSQCILLLFVCLLKSVFLVFSVFLSLYCLVFLLLQRHRCEHTREKQQLNPFGSAQVKRVSVSLCMCDSVHTIYNVWYTELRMQLIE